MRSDRGFVFASAVIAPLFSTLSAHAAEEGGNPAVETATEIFKWINFAILAGVLVWVFGKLLRPWFQENARNVASAITKATAAKVAANAQLQEAETKLSNLQKETAELQRSAKRDAEAETERIRALTQSDAQKIAAAARAEIEAAERAARLELKALAARLAVDGAESLLAKELTAQTHAALIGTFVKSLEARPN